MDQQFSQLNTDEVPQTNGELSPRRRKLDKILTICLSVAVCVLVLSLAVKLFVLGTITISGASMMPNFQSGQKVWVNKLAKPRRGDVAVFYVNQNVSVWDELSQSAGKGGKAEKYIKRVVAVEGDKIWCERQGEKFYLVIQTSEGEILREDYYTVGGNAAVFWDQYGNECDVPCMGTVGDYLDTADASSPYEVPEGCFFALGDNRYNSRDSRAIGPVPYSRVFGVVI